MLIQIKTQDFSQGIDGSTRSWTATLVETKIFSIPWNFFGNLTNSCVPLPTYGESWIRLRKESRKKGSRTAKKRKKYYFWYNLSYILSQRTKTTFLQI